MSETTLTFAPFGPSHLPGALALSQAEHWPHRAEDWAMVLSLGRGVVALDQGRVAGTALVTRFGEVGLVNMIIVGAALRGRGLGRRLVEAAMARADVTEFRLIATPAGLPLYRNMGFHETGEIVQHQGFAAPVPFEAPDVSGAALPDLAALAALDLRATGMDRARLIDHILRQGRIAVRRQDSRITAWAGLRPFGRGLVAGPVIAPDADSARTLLCRVMADHPGAFLRVDTQADSGLPPWLETLNLTRVGGGIAMSTAPRPRTDPLRSFALAAQAFG
ncbi:GNAT family N-acetyltransferase [Paracoccus gahaiensis]|uniref:GNAT family N-acetyltransferase n=1 Tax=Paracoccus gahaiensis TaxID=1706839 RepID=A0A4U0R980_9RHOB|nr:GNAT family N-acetyltransferase [Paracoccus gahaiensis]TJZ90892.1 GNAT family N-acetyltransferase [Paracoccus gahaiensis]